MSVADGRSTADITATVRDSTGRTVPDGTQVMFQTDLGTLRDSVVTTVNGFARTVLVASGTPGYAHITATAVRGDSVPSTFVYEFVANKALLKAATTYIEVVSSTSLLYSLDNKFITASGPANPAIPSQKNGGVSVRYGDIRVVAEDIQLSQDYELRARRATLTVGKGPSQYFQSLYLTLNTGMGIGIGPYKTRRPTMVAAFGTRGIVYLAQDDNGKWTVAPDQMRYMALDISPEGLIPRKTPVPAGQLDFAQLEDSTSMIGAKKAIVFPRREIQFQRADVYVQSARVLHVPLYDLQLTQNQQPGLVTGGILAVNDNQVCINYPQYLSLQPGLTSLVRFSTGTQPGTGADSSGLFLDYELNWNHGDSMQGGLTFGGSGANDWAVGLKQFYQVNSKTTFNMDVDLPQGNSFLGFVSAATQLPGFRLSVDSSATETFTGIREDSQNYNLGLDKDPIKMGRLPVTLTVGLTADREQNSLISETQQGYGLRATFQSANIDLGEKAILRSNLTFTKLDGEGELPGIGVVGSVNLSRPLFPGARGSIGYAYTHDGFNDSLVGEHSFNYTFGYSRGRLSAQLTGSRGLDIVSTMVNGMARFDLSRLWSLTSTYTSENFESSRFLDYGFGFAYQLGIGPMSKGIGLVWHYQTQRLGIQFLGTSGF